MIPFITYLLYGILLVSIVNIIGANTLSFVKKVGFAIGLVLIFFIYTLVTDTHIAFYNSDSHWEIGNPKTSIFKETK
jgi:FtsH-binding integral membrane protein